MAKDKVWTGTMLEELMKETGVTQEKLALALGMKQPQVSRMWDSAFFRKPTIAKLEKFFSEVGK